ncbi:MAG: hypothetical protein CO034_01975 [Parcubacteria group bacterium CG_4_9_14_0_2_um_filter_35_11]|nr:MAG: hypothetical protein CO034_01975 [Parcubacteria group bacterium CG_4_9_14_0_2_um_filter_35_11]
MSRKIGLRFELRQKDEKKRDKKVIAILILILVVFLPLGLYYQSTKILLAGIFLVITFAALWIGDLIYRVQRRIEEQTYEDVP